MLLCTLTLGIMQKFYTRVVRYGEVNLELQTVLADELETKRAVLFCSATLQPPYHAARLRVGKPPSEVFVSSVMRGSPASHYGLSPATFITHVNDTVACELDSFLEAAMTIAGNASKSNLMSDRYWIIAKATYISL
jgi:pro-apoptotic serine protease NMA111